LKNHDYVSPAYIINLRAGFNSLQPKVDDSEPRAIFLGWFVVRRKVLIASFHSSFSRDNFSGLQVDKKAPLGALTVITGLLDSM
jgi:hypothetical protein